MNTQTTAPLPSGRHTRRSAAIIGIGQSDWAGDWLRTRAGERPTDSYGYALTALNGALSDAGLQRSDLDGLIAGPATAYERLGELAGLDPRWGGQADAVSAVSQAVMAVESGLAEVVALVYGNDQRSANWQYGGPNAMGGGELLSYVYHAPWGFSSQGAIYALMFQRFMHERGVTQAELGEVAVAQRAWASRNPRAVMRKTITIEDYLAAKFICEPLRLYDYCFINDGGVAIIVAEAERARALSDKPVFIEAIGRQDLNRGATSFQPRLESFYLPAQQAAAERSYAISGLGPEDMDVFQVYDSFSVHVPLALEGYGYCRPGEAGKFLREKGVGPGGAMPTNTGGGHLSETYMQGWAHQLECVRQLRGECGERQVQSARHAHYTSDVAGKCFSIIYGR